MHPRKLIRESLLYAVVQYLVRAGLMLRGLIAARLLGPEAYGAWNALLLIVDYGGQSNLGTYEGLDQTTPGRIVDGDQKRLLQLKRAAMFNGLILPLVFALGVLMYLFRPGDQGEILTWWGFTGVIAALVVVLSTSVGFIHLSLLRSHDRIPLVSQWFLVQGAIGVGLGLGLIPWLGAWALLWSWLLGTLVATLFVRWREPTLVPLGVAPSRDSIQLLRVGFPMFITAASRFVMRTIDRVVILRFLGTLELGYYSLSAMALTLLLYIPDSVTYVLYPQLLRVFHSTGRSIQAVRDRVERVTKIVSIVVPFMAGLGFLMAESVVRYLLPQFAPGVAAVQVACFGAMGVAIASLAAIVLMTLDRRRVLIPVSLGATALTAALDYSVVRAGHGILGVAWATVAVYLLHGAALHLTSLRAFGDSWSRALANLLRIHLPLVVAAAVAVGVRAVFPAEGGPLVQRAGRLLLTLVIFSGLFFAIVRPLARGLGLRALLAEIRLPGTGRVERDGDV